MDLISLNWTNNFWAHPFFNVVHLISSVRFVDNCYWYSCRVALCAKFPFNLAISSNFSYYLQCFLVKFRPTLKNLESIYQTQFTGTRYDQLLFIENRLCQHVTFIPMYFSQPPIEIAVRWGMLGITRNFIFSLRGRKLALFLSPSRSQWMLSTLV